MCQWAPGARNQSAPGGRGAAQRARGEETAPVRARQGGVKSNKETGGEAPRKHPQADACWWRGSGRLPVARAGLLQGPEAQQDCFRDRLNSMKQLGFLEVDVTLARIHAVAVLGCTVNFFPDKQNVSQHFNHNPLLAQQGAREVLGALLFGSMTEPMPEGVHHVSQDYLYLKGRKVPDLRFSTRIFNWRMPMKHSSRGHCPPRFA